ncbi:YkgJ family cysteine cluster protein [Carboxylicivirga sediminis]|uniref:YkgJ family cysteine cluster protein n=1 Tax=Carboxylicivirga sediminis TaxID=2006564 RepID=A0A941F3G2_9BACT|nr:YkgJ family cysteine cluster protein [Carboxylicivirga sediminis]MBR8535343.1 YkgJ family cysteine cluster protein [Carboxylicivirga sediminis]
MDKHELSETDKAFFQDGLRLAEAATNNQPAASKLWQATRQEQDAIEGLIEALGTEAARQNITIDCRKGCSWCCHQPIFGVSHEFHYLWKFIELNMSENEQQDVLQRAFDNYQKRGRLSQDELNKSKLPCPLLKDGACSAYPARPMACRIYLSMSEESCKRFHDSPEDENNYPALLEFPLRAGQMMNEGFTEGLKPTGMVNNEYLMEEGLLIAHNNGDPIDENNLSNHSLFKKH